MLNSGHDKIDEFEEFEEPIEAATVTMADVIFLENDGAVHRKIVKLRPIDDVYTSEYEVTFNYQGQLLTRRMRCASLREYNAAPNGYNRRASGLKNQSSTKVINKGRGKGRNVWGQAQIILATWESKFLD